MKVFLGGTCNVMKKQYLCETCKLNQNGTCATPNYYNNPQTTCPSYVKSLTAGHQID